MSIGKSRSEDEEEDGLENSNNNNCTNKLIQCGACFRSFHTQAQFGQHSRICREGKAVIRHLIQTDEYKYSFIEKQIQRKLEIKTRFVVHVNDPENWKKISRQNGLFDGAIKKMLISKQILNVDIAVRQRKASGLIIANFLARNVGQNAEAIHTAKTSIERAVDAVFAQLPEDIDMKLHVCKAKECQELVIRDTEGFCSRHRAQKYHKKSHNQKMANKLIQIRQRQIEPIQRSNKRASKQENGTEDEGENVAVSGDYSNLLNHLKATAPLSSDTTTSAAMDEDKLTTKGDDEQTNEIKTENSKNVHMHDNVHPDITNDDEIVAQILTSLREKYYNEAIPPSSTSSASSSTSVYEDGNLQLPPISIPPPAKKRKLQLDNMNGSEWNSEIAPTRPYLLVPVPVNSSLCCTQFPLQPPALPSVQFVPAVMNVSNHQNYIQNNNYWANNNNNVQNGIDKAAQILQLQALIDLVKNTSNCNPNMNNLTIPPNVPPLPPMNGLFPSFNPKHKN